MTCSYLNDEGVPSECFRSNIDLCLAIYSLVTTLWCSLSYYRHSRRIERYHLSPKDRSWRFAALAIAISTSLFSVLGGLVPKYFVFSLGGVCLLHYVELYILPQKVASWELLLFWPSFCVMQAFRLIDPSNRVLVGITIGLASVIIGALVSSSPKVSEVAQFDDANLYMRFSFSFMTPIIAKAHAKILSAEDLSAPPSAVIRDEVHRFAEDYHLNPAPPTSLRGRLRIWWLMLFITKRSIFIQGFYLLSINALNFFVPSVMQVFLQRLSMLESSGSQADFYGSLWLGGALAFTGLLYCALRAVSFYYDLALIMEWRYILSNYTYRKAMRINCDARQEYNSGKIMNLITNDVAVLQNSYGFLVSIVKQPYAIVLGSIQLHRMLGPSFWYTFPLFILHTLLSSFFQGKAAKGLPKQSAARDARNKSTLSLLRNIKSLKLYAWEEPFEKKVDEDYAKERNEIKKYLVRTVSISAITSQMSNILLGLIILSFLLTSSKPLTPDTLFPLIRLTIVAVAPYSDIPELYKDFADMMNSEQRLEEFYQQPETSEQNYYRSALNKPEEHSYDIPRVDVTSAEIAWPKTTESPSKQDDASRGSRHKRGGRRGGHQNDGQSTEQSPSQDNHEATTANTEPVVCIPSISIQVKKGDMLCVLGKIGTGKTALIQSLIGQMSILKGAVALKGSIAYSSQEPWLQFLSVRDNILFGLEYDEEFYNRVIAACELTNDLEIFPEGDATMVGEKGITLSGGQKARLALARAIYSRADILILDDVLSAVDQHVCESLLVSLFSPEKGIVADKAVILATHSSRALKYSSQILSLGMHGEVQYYGPAAEAPSVVFSSITSDEDADSAVDAMLPSKDYDRRKILFKRETEDRAGTPEPRVFVPSNDLMYFSKAFSRAEKPRSMSILDALKRYFVMGSKSYAAITMSGTALRTAASVVTTLWLSYWSGKKLSGLSASKMYLLVYFVLLFVQIFSDMASRFTFQAIMVTEIVRRIHDTMLHNVIHSSMQFFESTPLGTIINRFTGDLAFADRMFPRVAFNFVLQWITAGSSFLLAVAGAPFIIIFAIPLLLLCKSYQGFYLPATSQATNLMAASRAPILSHVEESTKGFPTVSAFDKSNEFIESMAARQRYQQYTTYNTNAIRRWLLTRVMVISAIITGSAAISLVAGVRYLGIPVSLAGVTLLAIERSNAQIRGILMGFQRFEQSTNAVERLFALIDQPTEAAYSLPGDYKENANWLVDGTINFEGYSTRFRPELPFVLHDINLKVKKKEKIGVVGRTGAGKTTMAMALFRILEAAEGKIEIDGTDISALGLYNLRSKLSSIPQDAQIFRGTLRENLDPTGEYTDGELWNVLELCHLKSHFGTGTASPMGLDTELIEGGENVSRGQAQLICLGRALLRPSRILVLDEATASVDGNTDSVVQRTIKTEFADRTIITIAHRLDTIMDSDRVLVLSQGRIIEQGNPQELVNSGKGALYDLVNSTGSNTIEE